MGFFKKETEEEKQAKKEKGNYVSYGITPDMNEKDIEILKRSEKILVGRGLQAVNAKIDTVILRDYI